MGREASRDRLHFPNASKIIGLRIPRDDAWRIDGEHPGNAPGSGGRRGSPVGLGRQASTRAKDPTTTR
jgi:hypothetical protein